MSIARATAETGLALFDFVMVGTALPPWVGLVLTEPPPGFTKCGLGGSVFGGVFVGPPEAGTCGFDSGGFADSSPFFCSPEPGFTGIFGVNLGLSPLFGPSFDVPGCGSEPAFFSGFSDSDGPEGFVSSATASFFSSFSGNPGSGVFDSFRGSLGSDASFSSGSSGAGFAGMGGLFPLRFPIFGRLEAVFFGGSLGFDESPLAGSCFSGDGFSGSGDMELGVSFFEMVEALDRVIRMEEPPGLEALKGIPVGLSDGSS